MNVSTSSLERVDSHWAVLAIGEAARDRGLKVADVRLVKRAVGQQIDIEFEEAATDSDLLRKLALAYEVAAIEGLHALINPSDTDDTLRAQCASGAWRTFELRRLFVIPEDELERLHFILHLSALAYCGDRWSDLRRWFNENSSAISVPSVADVPWDRRILYRLFECWIRLLRKKRWDDLDRVREIIAGLREDQREYESGVLGGESNARDRTMALRLIALYHWAKGTELLAKYMLQGEPRGINELFDKHYESATKAAFTAGDSQLEVLLKWLHATSRQMVSGSLWWVAGAVNSHATHFVRAATKNQAMFELLPPQRAALQEQGLLDQAATAIIIDMPTSGGKTLLAQFRMLQALNQFDADHGWVAYVAPTRALTAQLTRKLRRDFEPIGVRVEQLTAAVEIDAFEEDLLQSNDEEKPFDILVATPEKLQMVIRNKKVSRPLALVVMDEAHNIEDKSRGMRIELLLATIKQDCDIAKFLLLMPYVENTEALKRWLTREVNTGRTISFGTSPWRPNERIVGIFDFDPDASVRAGWQLCYHTLTTTPKAIKLEGRHRVGGVKPLDVPKSKLSLSMQTAAMAKVMSIRGTSIAVANNINSTWTMARKVRDSLEVYSPIPPEVRLVQDFLRTEISPNFELVNMLEHGVAVHHAGLSDETRALIEWLTEEGKLRVLCATSTIAQGINFPVTSIFLASRFVPQGTQSVEMSPRDFWNLAGRAGRMNHDSVGVVGLAAGNDRTAIIDFVSRSTGHLISRMVNLLNQLETTGQLDNLEIVFQEEQWDDFRSYVAHLWNEKKNLEAVLADTEQLLRNTFGYNELRSSSTGRVKADKLLEVTKTYARKLARNPGPAELADMTGFSPEGVLKAMTGISQLENKLTKDDWKAESLFGNTRQMADLFGVMLQVPQLARSLKEIGGEGPTRQHIAEITNAWVSGSSIQEIASQYFQEDENPTLALTKTCKAIYRNLTNMGTWGLSALTRVSGIDFDSLSDTERRQINTLPAMIYHGVKSEAAVLMRMNNLPRSIAERAGEALLATTGKPIEQHTLGTTREYLKSLTPSEWNRLRPEGAALSGQDYRTVWERLSGESGGV